jgi:hypothetical protein
MTFTKSVSYTGSNAISNIWAKTSDAWTLWTTFLTTTIVWNLLQTYSSILTNAINPVTKQILRIGNTAVDTKVEFATQTGRTAVLHLGDGPDASGDIDIGNGLGSLNHIQLLHAADNGSSGVVNLGSATSTTNLYSPFTPLHSYPVGTATGQNTPSIGTAGTIGFIAPTTFISNGTGTGSNGAGGSQRSVSLTPGTWLVAGTARTPGFAGSNAITITTQQNNVSPGPIYGRKGTWQYPIQPTYPWGLATMAIVNLSTTTTLYMTVRNDSFSSVNYNNFTCIRIA